MIYALAHECPFLLSSIYRFDSATLLKEIFGSFPDSCHCSSLGEVFFLDGDIGPEKREYSHEWLLKVATY